MMFDGPPPKIWLPPKPAIIRPAPDLAMPVPGIIPAGGHFAGAVEVAHAAEYLGSIESSGYDASWNGSLDAGAAVAGAKYVGLAGAFRASGLPSFSATVGGNSCTIISGLRVDNGDARCDGLFFDDATGAVSGSTAFNTALTSTGGAGAVSWFKITGSAAGQPYNEHSLEGGSNTTNLTLDVVSNGIVIGFSYRARTSGSTGFSWSGDMVDGDEVVQDTNTDSDYAAAMKQGLSADAAFDLDSTSSGGNGFGRFGLGVSFAPA